MTQPVDSDTSGNGCSNSASSFPKPNAHEAMFFFNIIKSIANPSSIGWDAVATDTGFKNAAVAKKRFYQIKQKLGLNSRPGSSPATTAKCPHKPRGSAKVTKHRKSMAQQENGVCQAATQTAAPSASGSTSSMSSSEGNNDSDKGMSFTEDNARDGRLSGLLASEDDKDSPKI